MLYVVRHVYMYAHLHTQNLMATIFTVEHLSVKSVKIVLLEMLAPFTKLSPNLDRHRQTYIATYMQSQDNCREVHGCLIRFATHHSSTCSVVQLKEYTAWSVLHMHQWTFPDWYILQNIYKTFLMLDAVHFLTSFAQNFSCSNPKN